MRRLRILLAMLVTLTMVLGVAGIGLAGGETTEAIQDAINAAAEGQVIEVEPGTYEGHIAITTAGLTLVALDGATIEGSITINADGVTVEGFTVKGDGEGEGVVVLNSDEATLKDLVITGWQVGIFLSTSSDASITGGNILDCGVGIDVVESDGVEIAGNEFSSNNIHVQDDGEDLDVNEVIAENQFDRAVVVRGSAIKVPVIFSSIQDAVDEAAPGDTVEVYPGDYEENVSISTDEVTVTSTEVDTLGAGTVVTALNTGVDGGGVFTIEADQVAIRGFTITGGRNGVSVTGDANLVAHNTIIEQARFNGIVVHSGEGNTIEFNRVIDNPSTGILVLAGASETGIYNNVVTGNNLSRRHGAVEVASGATGTILRFNCIADNYEYGVFNDGTETVSAELNWWGDADGPGDAVSAHVEYEPWLSALIYVGDTEFTELDFALEAELLDSDNEGVEGVTIRFYIDDEYVGSEPTDSDGVATLPLENHYVGQGNRDITVKAAGCMTDTVEVSFDQEDIEEYTLTVRRTGTGTVELDGDEIDVFPHSVQYEPGTEVALEAIPGDGYQFHRWYGDVDENDRNDEQITLVMDGDLDVRAGFVPEGTPHDPDEDVTVRLNPRVINLRARGVLSGWIQLPGGYDISDVAWVELRINGESVRAEWIHMANRVLMVKFDGVEVADILPMGDEVELWIEAYVDGTLYGGTDTVRVILPGAGPRGDGPPGQMR